MDGFDVTTIVAVGSLVLGIVGTTLGVTNFLRDVSRDKVKLRVVPRLCFRQGGGLMSVTNSTHLAGRLPPIPEFWLGIEVINLSTFPVTIDEIGFCDRDPRKNRRSAIAPPILLNGETWPVRLGPRESFTGYGDFHEFLSQSPLEHFQKAYAVTSCDKYGSGRSDILRDIRSLATQLRKRS